MSERVSNKNPRKDFAVLIARLAAAATIARFSCSGSAELSDLVGKEVKIRGQGVVNSECNYLNSGGKCSPSGPGFGQEGKIVGIEDGMLKICDGEECGYYFKESGNWELDK